ncbi:MAG: hypothetical protein ABIB61_04555 [Candidatus Shapirobacteria bacterium]
MESKERISPIPSREQLIRSSEPKLEVPKNIEGWIEKVEKKDLYLTKPTMDDQGQVIVTSAQAKPVKIVLPLDKSGLVSGLSTGIGEAVRWLAEWCLRLIKINPNRVSFKTKEKSNESI